MRNLMGFTSINVGLFPIDMFNPAVVVVIGCTVFPIGCSTFACSIYRHKSVCVYVPVVFLSLRTIGECVHVSCSKGTL